MEFVDYSKSFNQSIEVLEECFKTYKLDETFVAFNGGKDCTVLLDLIIKVLSKTDNCKMELFRVVYIQPENPFPELEDFIFSMKEHYNINLIVLKGNIKLALEMILKENNNMKACLMGTRRSDPYSEHLDFFTMTDANWPQIMRVSPLLDWSYREIWSYLLDKNVPYCKLYDLGYTSLGNTVNTKCNPWLKIETDTNDGPKYKPAYHLKDSSKERDGRIDVKK